MGIRLSRLVAAIVASVAFSTISGATASPAPLTMTWGAEVRPTEASMSALETSVGRQFATTRIFLKWDTTFPDAYQNWLLRTNHTLMVSVRARRVNGAFVKWADIANAQPGTALYDDIVGWSDRLSALAVPVWFTLNHEPEATINLNNGSNADYVAAWHHIVDIFRSRGVTNVQFMWIMTDYSFGRPPTDARYAPKWYPGDDYVDGVAEDAYNWYTCRTGVSNPWRSLATIVEPMRQFGLLHPLKPLYLTEWGSVEDPNAPGRKAQWISAARDMFKDPAYSQFAGVSYFNYPGNGPCVIDVNSSASALSAFKAMGSDAFYS